jgi:hypothetical protein
MTDDGSVLGNLPRSRPGQRSEKRDPDRKRKPRSSSQRPAGAGAAAASKAERGGTGAAKPARGTDPGGGTRPGRTAAARRAAGTPAGDGPHRRREHEPGGGDPVGGAVRAVTGIAAAGARVANGVAREVMRRIPRP